MLVRYFMLLTCAFNLFTGTGYFFFSGVTNFGDWAAVISGLHLHWFWRVLLVVVGACSYYAAVLVVGIGLVRYVGVPRDQQGRLRRLSIAPYLSAIVLSSAGTAEPSGNATPVAIRPARDCWRSERSALAAILYPAKN
jgi:hypothetical protein